MYICLSSNWNAIWTFIGLFHFHVKEVGKILGRKMFSQRWKLVWYDKLFAWIHTWTGNCLVATSIPIQRFPFWCAQFCCVDVRKSFFYYNKFQPFSGNTIRFYLSQHLIDASVHVLESEFVFSLISWSHVGMNRGTLRIIVQLTNFLMRMLRNLCGFKF